MITNTPEHARLIRNWTARRATALAAADKLLRFPSAAAVARDGGMTTSDYIVSFRKLNSVRIDKSGSRYAYTYTDAVPAFLPHAFVNLHGDRL